MIFHSPADNGTEERGTFYLYEPWIVGSLDKSGWKKLQKVSSVSSAGTTMRSELVAWGFIESLKVFDRLQEWRLQHFSRALVSLTTLVVKI